MKIDVTPIKYQADDYHTTVLKARGLTEYYVVKLQNGYNFYGPHALHELEQFQPSKTVSEQLISWEESIKRKYDVAFEAVRTKRHPIYKVWSTRMVVHKWGSHLIEESYETDEYRRLDKYDIANYKAVMKKLLPQLGKMEFATINL